MPVSVLSPAQRDSDGQALGDPSTHELARDCHLDDSDHTQIVETRGDAKPSRIRAAAHHGARRGDVPR